VSLDDAERALENAIVEYEKATNEVGKILVGWVVAAEFMDEDGQPYLAAYAARGMPFWRIDGLIDAAPHAILYMEEVEDD
jgi:hypothetical protein